MTENLLLNWNPEIDLVLCGYNLLKKTGENIINETIEPYKEYEYSLIEFIVNFPEYFRKKLVHSPCNKLFDAKLISENNLKFSRNIHNGEDLLFNLDYLRWCRKIKVIKEPLYYYIQYNNKVSLTKTYKSNYFENRKLVYNKIEDFLKESGDLQSENYDLMKEVYTNYVINIFENVLQKDNLESKLKIRKEFNKIIKDKWIRNNLGIFRRKKIQERLIYILILTRMNFGLRLFLTTKITIKNKFTKFYNLLKKLN